MNPIETLMAEHRLIRDTLDALQAWAEGVTSGDADERDELQRFVTFIRDFVDPVHHGKEEDILFTTMVAHGFSREQGPLAVMMHEHEESRALIDTLARFAQQESRWSEGDRLQISRAAQSYAALLRQHIAKEDQVLYPMSQLRLPESAKAQIAEKFTQFEREHMTPERRTRLLGLAEELVGRHAPRAPAR